MNATGCIVVDLRNLDAAEPVPTGCRLRVRLGRAGYLSLSQLHQIAYLAAWASAVEIEGERPSAVGDVLDYLRSHDMQVVG